ncbi:MAG: hypothetical protein ABDH63_07580, partial [Candidatus Caldarchaeales archaeon]
MGSSPNPEAAAERVDLNVNGELPVVCVAVLYHSKKGDVLARMLDSLAAMDYPKEKVVLLLIDNYSSDGAFETCSKRVEDLARSYRGIIHVRAKGSVSRLRNIALRLAHEAGFDFIA